MRVVLIQKAEDVIAELFGPIQEAARKPFLFGKFFQFFLHINACFIDLNPTEVWCELAELRLSSLVCEYKPVGINRNFHLLAIHERMHKIFDNEPPQFEIYLSDKNKVLFRKQQNDLLLDETTPRTTYPPKYSCRPTLEMINEKLGQWFGMKVCEENESDPPGFSEHSDYTLPEYIMEEREDHRSSKESLKNSEIPHSLNSTTSVNSAESMNSIDSEEPTHNRKRKISTQNE
ncbi:hypothetical protein CAEBREN_13798 [Caenorhabditis brenneri]|uniref:Uncharacterized protein n=1 Tax=Caenorhabditis brenneri TaxID=135651 RepID=G0N9P9_CAEBE|nr:hypothetical protein CAEBREN_13798 [Caenorhabditis brenneri]